MSSETSSQSPRRQYRGLLLLTCCVGAACSLLIVPAGAAAQNGIAPPLQSTPVPTVVSTGAPPPGDGHPASGTPTPQPNIIQQIIRHTITFSSSSLIQAITEAFVELGRKSMDGAVKEVLPAMDASMAWLTEVDSTGLSKFPDFEQAVRAAWNAMLKVALVFAPLVLAMTVLAILGGGGSAAEARAEVIAQALQVLVSYATAAASFYLLSLGIRASWGLTAFIWSMDLGVEIEPVRVLLGGVITALSTLFLSMTVPLFAIYLLFFLVFLILALLGALGLALAGTTALLALGVIIAPLMIALGSMPQFRWLTWTWTRLMTGLLLLPVLNAILIKVASLMHVTMLGSLGGGSLGSALLSFFVVGGALSLVIGINYKVGHLVFAPLMEIHKKAFGATKTVALLAAAGTAIALGGPSVLKAGLGLGATVGPTGTGGGVGGSLQGAVGSGLSTPGSGALGGPGSALPATTASAALSTLAGMSGNPAVRGALNAAAQGFRNAALNDGRGLGGRGIDSQAGGAGPGGVYSVSTHQAASSILGDRSTPEAVQRLAARPEFHTALRSARQHAAGLERAGIPFSAQVRESGFPDAAGYMGGLAFQVGHGHLDAGLKSAFAATVGVGPGTAPGSGSPGAEGRKVLTSLGQRLGALGGDGFPGAEGQMRVLKQAGWWSFNPSPDDPGFGRYAQAFLRAGQYLAEAGEESALGALERAVQMARGDPSREITASEHMARIQAQILDGDFGKHQESLARLFETKRG